MKCVFPYNGNRRKAALCAAILLVVLLSCVLLFMPLGVNAVPLENVFSAADCFSGVSDQGYDLYDFDVNMNLYSYSSTPAASGLEFSYTLSVSNSYTYNYPIIISTPGLHTSPMRVDDSFNDFTSVYSIDNIFVPGSSVTFYFSVDCSVQKGFKQQNKDFKFSSYLYFYDEFGKFLTSFTNSYSPAYSANFESVLSNSISAVVPENSAYFVAFSAVHCCYMINGTTVRFSNPSISCEVLPPQPVDPLVNSYFDSSYSYILGALPSVLSVGASVTDSGSLSYQWYENTTNSTAGGVAIPGATSATYTPFTDEVGTKYYYCAVTNTLGEYTSTVYSNVAAVSVSKPVAGAPTVSSNFAPSYTYKIGDTASSLSVAASAPDGGTLTYQWYIVTDPDGANLAEPVSGATDFSFVPALDYVGSRYYCCIVTNTLGDSTAWTKSDTLLITVKATSYTLSAGQYECNVASDGLYYPLFPWPEDIKSVDLTFRSSGIPYSQIFYKYDVINGGYCIYYDADKAYQYAEDIRDEGFVDNLYALIFLEADQEVPTDFYEWFVGNFTYIGADEEIPVYYTTINIMDNAGNNLLDGITYPGMGVSPVLYGYVVGNGLTVLTSSGREWPWTVGDDVEDFLGFSLEPGAAAAWYIPEETFTIGGTASDAVLTLYLVVTVSTSVDDDYAASSLKWYERLFYGISKGFTNLGTRIESGFNDLIAALAPSEGAKLLGIIDFASIGEFFRTAYEGLGDFFGLADLLSGDTSPFAWLVG